MVLESGPHQPSQQDNLNLHSLPLDQVQLSAPEAPGSYSLQWDRSIGCCHQSEAINKRRILQMSLACWLPANKDIERWSCRTIRTPLWATSCLDHSGSFSALKRSTHEGAAFTRGESQSETGLSRRTTLTLRHGLAMNATRGTMRTRSLWEKFVVAKSSDPAQTITSLRLSFCTGVSSFPCTHALRS